MSSTETEIQIFSSKVTELLDSQKSTHQINKDNLNTNIDKLKQIKNSFKNKFAELIEKIGSLEFLDKKQDDEIEDSPAAFHTAVPRFEDGSNIFRQTIQDFYTFSCPEMLSDSFEVKIKLNKSTSGYVVIGVSDKVFDVKKGYLGGDMGKGNWGIASNGSLGNNGSWTSGKTYNTGDIVTIKGEDGEISYAVNDVFDEKKYHMDTTELYLSFTLYYTGDELEILD